MKNLIFAAVLLLSTSAFAAIDPSEHNCADMQAHLATHGQISIQRLFGETVYTAASNCGVDGAREHYEWAKDTSACQLGWDCIPSRH